MATTYPNPLYVQGLIHALKTSGADVYPLGKKKKKTQKKAQGEGGEGIGGENHPQPLVRPRVEMHLNLPRQ